VSEPKSVAELRELVRQVAARKEHRELVVTIRSVSGRPNWDCAIKYTDPHHSWGPTPAFVKELENLKNRFHLE
jgi:hypothetical protein